MKAGWDGLTIRLTGRRPACGWIVEAAAGQRLRSTEEAQLTETLPGKS